MTFDPKFNTQVIHTFVDSVESNTTGPGLKSTSHVVTNNVFKDRPLFQQAGFCSIPRSGTHGLIIRQNHAYFMIATADESTSRPALNSGDVCIYTDENNYVLIRSTGDIQINSNGTVTVLGPAGGAQGLVTQSYATALQQQLVLIGAALNTLGQPIAPFVPPVDGTTITLQST